MLVEGWNAWDAFYMTVISVTTAGYREVHDLSRAGQLFTAALLIGGVGAVFYALTMLAAGIIESRLRPRAEPACSRRGRRACGSFTTTGQSARCTVTPRPWVV